jgi:PAS domain S-box-containing protein
MPNQLHSDSQQLASSPPSRVTAPRLSQGPTLDHLLDALSRTRDALERTQTIARCFERTFAELNLGMAVHEVLTDASGQPVDYRYLQANARFARMLGLPLSQLVGRRVLEVFPSTESSWVAIYGRVALSGETLRFEAMAGACGRVLEVLALQAGPGRFVLVLEDVTARRELEDALTASRADHRELAENVNEMIWVVASGRILFANLACCLITGFTPEELEAMDIPDLVIPGDRERYRALLDLVHGDSAACAHVQLRLSSRDRETLPVNLGARRTRWDGVPAVLHVASLTSSGDDPGDLPAGLATGPVPRSRPTDAPEVSPAAGEPPLILMVDDEPQLLQATRRILQRHGYRTRAHVSSLSALEDLSSGTTPDLVVTDIDMPELDGIELYRRVRTIHPDQKFLFVTGSPERLQACSAGRDREHNLLMKPFDSESLMQAVNHRLATPLAPPAEVNTPSPHQQ